MAITYTIRVHAIPLTDADGGRACKVKANQFAKAIDGVNRLYESARIRFDFDANRDWHPRRDTSLNSLQNAGRGFWTEANAVAAQHRGAMVVFLRWGDKQDKPASNWFAYPPDTGQRKPKGVRLPHSNIDFIAVGNQTSDISKAAGVLSHEIGHYLGLFHTHPGWGFTSTETIHDRVRADGLAGMDGDLLRDTRPDPGWAYYKENVSTDKCGGPASFTVLGKRVRPDKGNIMSYFRCPPLHFSPQQIATMRRTLRHAHRKHLIAGNLGVRYTGVFRAGNAGHALWVGDDWAGFADKCKEFADDGLRLIDLESYVVGGKRRFTGVFEQGTGGQALWVDDDWRGFTEKWKELSDDGLRLIDFETWKQGRGRRYAGVFRAGGGGYALWVDDDWKGFTDKHKELSDDGLRLIDFESWKEGRVRKFAGVFRAGGGGYALWVDDDWKGFTDKHKELSDDGLRLIDFETWKEGRVRKFAGVFAAGNGKFALWHNDDWFGFEQKWRELSDEGLRLVDLEVFGSKVT